MRICQTLWQGLPNTAPFKSNNPAADTGAAVEAAGEAGTAPRKGLEVGVGLEVIMGAGLSAGAGANGDGGKGVGGDGLGMLAGDGGSPGAGAGAGACSDGDGGVGPTM